MITAIVGANKRRALLFDSRRSCHIHSSKLVLVFFGSDGVIGGTEQRFPEFLLRCSPLLESFCRIATTVLRHGTSLVHCLGHTVQQSLKLHILSVRSFDGLIGAFEFLTQRDVCGGKAMHLVHHLSVLFVEGFVCLRRIDMPLPLPDKCIVASSVLLVGCGKGHPAVIQFSTAGCHSFGCTAELLVESSHVSVSQTKLGTDALKEVSVGRDIGAWGCASLEALSKTLRRSDGLSRRKASFIPESQLARPCSFVVAEWPYL